MASSPTTYTIKCHKILTTHSSGMSLAAQNPPLGSNARVLKLMELRAALLALLAGTTVGIAFVAITGALCFFGYSEQVFGAPDAFFDFLFFIPAAVLGFVAGRTARSKALLAAFLAGVLSALLWIAATFILARAVGESFPQYTAKEFLITDVLPLVLGMGMAHFTFRVRQRSNKSRVDVSGKPEMRP